MKLMARRSSGDCRIDVVIGCGLIGRAVVNALGRLPGESLYAAEVPVVWTSAETVRAALDRGMELVRKNDPAPARARVFWCAGRAGFASSESDIAGELAAFLAVLRWAEEWSREIPLELHVASSAGGLHEGQILVTDPSHVTDARPYARLKLSQEAALMESTISRRFVYRPSSVYGTPRPGQRLGLLPTFVLNALRHRPTTITANQSTQRDFIAADDVGSFIAAERGASDRVIHYLVSGQAVSLWALQLVLERHLQHRVTVHYTTSKDNFASTTFSPSIRPTGWQPSSLECNVARIVGAVQGRPFSR